MSVKRATLDHNYDVYYYGTFALDIKSLIMMLSVVQLVAISGIFIVVQIITTESACLCEFYRFGSPDAVVTPVHGLPVFYLHYVMEGSSD